jgi:colanic acid biosynthesis protein WcaH
VAVYLRVIFDDALARLFGFACASCSLGIRRGLLTLTERQFLNIVDNAPLIAIDLVVKNAAGGILVGFRVNQPAKDTWFTPGGRIRKNETLQEAYGRLSQAELGERQSINEAQLIGVFTHRYDTNFAGIDGISTHYVVLAYEFKAAPEITSLPTSQHSKWRWARADERDSVHANVAAYFG